MNDEEDDTIEVGDKFRCPDCGDPRLEEVLANATVTTEVTTVGPDGYVDYFGEQENTDGNEIRYQCKHCGWVVPEVSNGEDLYQWLKDQPVPPPKRLTRPIEYLLALADGRWVTEVIQVPLPFPSNLDPTVHLINYGEETFMCGARAPEVVGVAIYNTMDDQEPENDG